MSIKNKISVLFLLVLCLELFSQTGGPPVLNATDDQVFCPGSAIKIAPSFTITPSPGDPGIVSFSIQISSGYQLNFDLLDIDTTPYPSIDTADWSPSEGKLTLTTPVGVPFLSYPELQSAVREVIFSTTATTITNEKKFSLTFGDANYLPKTDHFYQYIKSTGITWDAARTEAATRTYYGRTGYLATLLSQEEADFAGKQAAGAGWIGGSDAGTPDVWKWVTGPEAGTIFWRGRADGFSPDNGFAFWNNKNGSNEPNNFNNSNEDYVHITAPGVGIDGSWNDLTNTGDAAGNYQPKGYIVEFGTPGDPTLDIVAATRIYLTPNPTIATLINPICSGENAVFTIRGMANSTVSYTTDNGLTTQTETLDGSGQGTATVLGAMANTTIRLTSIDNGSCTSPLTNSATVTINPTPAITSLTSNGAVCIGTDAIFTIRGTANATVSYTTDGGLTNPTVILDAAGRNIITISGILGNTSIKLNNINGSSCSSILTNSTTVTISPSPAITSLTSNDPVCSGTDAIFTITGTANNTVSYTTDNGLTNQTVILDGSGQGTATVSGIMVDTTIKLTSINNNGCISSLTNSATVNINPNPAITSLTSNSPVCVGADAIFTINGSANATVNYTTDGGITNPTLILNATGENTVTISGVTMGNTTIKLNSINNSNCSSILTNTEIIRITPDPAITSLTSNNPICSGTDAVFTINGTANATVSYTTAGGATNQAVILDGSGEGTVTVATPINDTTIQLGSINVGSCSTVVSNTTMVTFTTTPDFDLAQNTYILCKDVGTITLKTLNPLENNYTYEWKKDGTTLSSVLDSIVTNSSGNYTVKAFSITGSGCESSEKSIEVIGSEEATITNNNVIIVDDSNNNSLQILTSNIGIGDYEFILDDVSGSYTDSSFFENIATGMHTLYARDKNGCGGIATYEFFVLAYPKFFTPNGDGKNDIWKIEGADDGSFTVADISIYNRFGVLLFQSDSSNLGWDGLSQGKILPSNTYWFKVILNGINGRKIEKTGRVSLMRK